MWFGEDWGAPVCEPRDHVPTPVGALCVQCEEPIEAHHRGFVLPQHGSALVQGLQIFVPITAGAIHQLCFLALVMPVVVHRLREGFAVCRFSTEVPARWPSLHYWSDKPKQITCEGCKQEQEPRERDNA